MRRPFQFTFTHLSTRAVARFAGVSATPFRWRLLEELDEALGSVQPDPLTIADSFRRVLHADDGGQPVLAGDHRAVSHEASDLGDEPPDRDEQRRPAWIG